MPLFRKYLKTQFKRGFCILPSIFFSFALFLICLGIPYLFLLSRFNPNLSGNQKIRIAIIGDKSNPYFDFIMKNLPSLDYSKNYVDILSMDEKTAEKQLNAGKIMCYAVIPDTFLDSVVEEINNCTYDYGNQIVFLVNAPITEMADAIQNGGTLTIPADAMCGFVNCGNGSGSVLEIKLKQPFTGKLRDMKKPAYQDNSGDLEAFYYDGYRYNVDEIYGLVNDAWDAKVDIQPSTTQQEIVETPLEESVAGKLLKQCEDLKIEVEIKDDGEIEVEVKPEAQENEEKEEPTEEIEPTEELPADEQAPIEESRADKIRKGVHKREVRENAETKISYNGKDYNVSDEAFDIVRQELLKVMRKDETILVSELQKLVESKGIKLSEEELAAVADVCLRYTRIIDGKDGKVQYSYHL